MIDYTDRDSIYNAIRMASGDNSLTLTLAQDIRSQMNKANNRAKTAEQSAKSNGINQDVQSSLDSLGLHSTDAEIRTGARALLISKLQSKEISAAEFAQFKDVFGLANDANDLDIQTVEFKSMCDECPLMDSPALPTGLVE